MNDLIEVILKELKKFHPRVYQLEAEDEAEFPFIIFSIDTSTNTDSRDNHILVIEIYDENQDTTAVEDLADVINEEFNYKCVNTNKFDTVFYKEMRKISPKDDKDDLECRELRFEMHTYRQ